nr:hypothetical protein [Actinomycetota bacterium]
ENDTLLGGPDLDLLIGGKGSDRLSAGNGNGPNQLYGNAGDDLLQGGESKDRLEGGPGDDILRAGPHPHKYWAYGRDVLRGGSGDDLIDGQNGNACAIFVTSPVQVDLGNGRATGEGSDSVIGIRCVQTAGKDDVVVGTNKRDVITTGLGDDTVFARGGPDWVMDNTRSRSGGDDIFYGGRGDDSLSGMEGYDTLRGGSGFDGCSDGESTQGCERVS